MGNEVRLTLVATGFTTREAFAGSAREKEITKNLRSLKTEEEFEVPSFLRQRQSYTSRPRTGTFQKPKSLAAPWLGWEPRTRSGLPGLSEDENRDREGRRMFASVVALEGKIAELHPAL